jgi:predicted alpha-1,2-mannosidase
MSRRARPLALVFLATSACAPPDLPPRLDTPEVSRWVDPFIGTGGHGHVYPGATVPFGMVQVSPDNGRSGWDWSSGYHWSDSVVTGFSHTHLSGTGIGDLLDVLVMPVTGVVELDTERRADGTRPYADRLDHAAEEAVPGYYAATLGNSGIHVELTATPRVGLHRVTYPEGADAGLVVDLGFSENWDTPTRTELIQVADTLFLGRRYSQGWAADQRVHFALVTSRPVVAVTLAGDEPRLRAHLDVGPADDDPLLLKVGISYVDEPGALVNVEAEAPLWDFDGARDRAARAWEVELSKVRVSGGSGADRAVFYTALYHTRLAPVLFQDVDGRYRGGDGSVHEAQGFVNYSIFSLWDTFRAAHPLNTLIDAGRVHDLVASMLAFRDEYGLLPVWSLTANETNTMTGNHAVPVVVDAVLKGLAGVDSRRALAAVVQSQSSDIRDLDDYRAHGWIPSDLGVEAVTKTLEYAFDDAAVARLADAVGEPGTAREFRGRSRAWQRVYDAETGFMRGRNTDGSWVEPFDPLRSDHRQNTDYTEGNAWQHSWFVPHDAAGLVRAMGGDQAFVDHLDHLFEQDTLITGEAPSADISGLIGQYAHGNEPSHHIAYLYSWAGRPDRTVERVRQIMATQYRAAPDGLAGNEDCGQMSAWYVFSALGFYPADPASGVYVLGAPLFDQARVRVQGGTLTVRALRAAPGDRYITGVRLNGRVWPLTFVRHADVAAGGLLEVELGPQPDPTWGREAWSRPPSDSDTPEVLEARARAEAEARSRDRGFPGPAARP